MPHSRCWSLRLLTASLAVVAPGVASAATFVVTSNADTAGTSCPDAAGSCTLRQAIGAANSAAGADVITFAIGSGPVTIAVAGVLQISSELTIDGTTQQGYQGEPVIKLDGGNGGGHAFATSTALPVNIRGLAIVRFSNGAGVQVGSTGRATIADCYLGTDGVTQQRNFFGVRVDNNAGVTISGNVISGNVYGVFAQGASTGALLIQNNKIGTNAAGTAAIPNANAGIDLDRSGTPSTISGNLISGNSDAAGVRIEGSANNRVEGNLIGTNAAGTAAIPNLFGVAISDTQIGATVFAGIGNVVGGSTPAARNVISGNRQTGVSLNRGSTVIGNYIGTNAAGTAALPNGLRGIEIQGAGNRVGGRTAAERNVISGNNEIGLYLVFNTAVQNVVEGNYIGTDASGANGVPNLQGGVWVNTIDAGGNLIGGTAAGAGNLIAFNGSPSGFNDGIFVLSGVNNSFLGNSIHSNLGLAIDLDPNGLNTNDPFDADGGPNNKQNHPLVTGTSRGTNTLTVQGTLASAASTTYRIEVFGNDACDASGSGEARYFLGAVEATTDANGNASFTGTFSNPRGVVVTLTATDPAGNTSEASPCVSAPIPDADRDGVPDGSDNCPQNANPEQADADADGLGDACDPTNDERCAEAVFADGLPQSYISGARHTFSVDFGTSFETVNRVRFVSEYDPSGTFDEGEQYYIESFGGQRLTGGTAQTRMELNTLNPAALADAQDGRLAGAYTGEIGEFTLTRFRVCVAGTIAQVRDTCAGAVFTPALPAAYSTGTTRPFTVNFGRTFARIESIRMISRFAQGDTFDSGERYMVDTFGGQQLNGGSGQTRMELNTLNPPTLSAFLDGQHSGNYASENGSFTLTSVSFCVKEPVPPDADQDGVPDGVDNCVNTANPDQLDADGDAIGDACDPTADADCVSARFVGRNLPITLEGPSGAAQWTADFGHTFARVDRLRMISLYADNDTFDGGERYSVSGIGGQQLTGGTAQTRMELNTLNPSTLDMLRDGLIDGYYLAEAGHFTLTRLIFCATGTTIVDTDSDGVADANDNCPAVANADQANGDGDALGDACDTCPADGANDADGDGRCANADNCPSVSNPSQADSDGDGLGDACDSCDDPDGDLACAPQDNCPSVANASQADGDGDGLGDACDACPADAANDADRDGVCGNTDNCPGAANASQADSDGDGLGDACDVCPLDAANDADRDGLCAGADPCPADPSNDVDGDGICGNADNCPTVFNPSQADLLGNGRGDLCEPTICEVAQRACRKDHDVDTQVCRDARDTCAASCTNKTCRDACKATMDRCLTAATAVRDACLSNTSCEPAAHCVSAAGADRTICVNAALEDGFECRQACPAGTGRAACIGACVATQRTARQSCGTMYRSTVQQICRAPFECANACRDAERDCKDDANEAQNACQAGCAATDRVCKAACDAMRNDARFQCDVQEAACTRSCAGN